MVTGDCDLNSDASSDDFGDANSDDQLGSARGEDDECGDD